MPAPGTSQLSAQLATTFLNLLFVLSALCSNAVAKRFGRRFMVIAGLALLSVVGLLGCVLSVCLPVVYLWSGLLGIGTGLAVPAISSMMVDYYSDEARQKLAGTQTAAVNLGGMLLSFFAGILAAQKWNLAYLIFLAALPVIIPAARVFPKEERQERARSARVHLPRFVWLAALQTFLFAILYFAFPTNAALLLAEKGYASSSITGIATAAFMLGGCLFGFVFTPLLRLCKNKTAAAAMVMLAVSYGVIFLTNQLPVLLIAAFLGGGSLSVMFPFFLLGIADRVDASASVAATSLVLCVAPNFGSFLSPAIITTLSDWLGNATVAFRFLLSALLAVLLGAVMFFSSRNAKIT